VLAHRELRLSLQDKHGLTIALLVPKRTLDGYNQSKIGIWLPLTPEVEETPVHEATFIPEFTDNGPLQATLSVSAFKDAFEIGETVFLNTTLTNTSEEVLDVQWPGFSSELDWIISDQEGKRVPLRLSKDRIEEFPGDRRAPRSCLLFPRESLRSTLNMSVLFILTSPGTYHVVARQIVRRCELAGQQQIASQESTFVIVPAKPEHKYTLHLHDDR